MAQYNVAEPFLASVRAHPDKTAVVFDGREITYRAMNDCINQMAGVLSCDLGVRPGDRVAYLLPELLELYYAVQKIGAVAVPLNYKLIPREVAYLTNASGARVLVFASQFAASVAEAAQSFASDVALVSAGGEVSGALDLERACAGRSTAEPSLFRDADALSRIQYTGGSTGLPKGAARTHGADLVELDAIMDSNGIGDDPDNVVLIQCPLEHHGGHSWFTIAFAAGATLVICEAFNAEQILHFIEFYRVTYMILLPPTTYLRLLRCPTIDQCDLSSVRLVQSAAGATTKPIIQAIYDKFPNAVLNYGWGQSESGAGSSLKITRAMLEADSPLLESVGRPMKHVEMKVVDEDGNEVPDGEVGEALFRSRSVMQGYYGQPDLTDEAFTPDGWLRTGDLMMRDADGYYYVRSRKKDMIKSGGENVFVAEVENVLRAHPAIDDCLVFGTSDPVMGEAVAAVIQPREGSNLTAAEVQTHCKNHISSYKKPRYVVFMDDMKRDSAGKVRKQDIVAYFDERKEQAAPRHHEKLRSDPDIYLIQVPYSGGTPIGYTNAYLIATDERNLLVDTGVSHEASYEVLRSALQDLRVDMAHRCVRHALPHRSSGSDRGHRARRHACIPERARRRAVPRPRCQLVSRHGEGAAFVRGVSAGRAGRAGTHRRQPHPARGVAHAGAFREPGRRGRAALRRLPDARRRHAGAHAGPSMPVPARSEDHVLRRPPADEQLAQHGAVPRRGGFPGRLPAQLGQGGAAARGVRLHGARVRRPAAPGRGHARAHRLAAAASSAAAGRDSRAARGAPRHDWHGTC